MTVIERFPVDQLDARRADLAAAYRELPGLSDYVSAELGYNFIALYLDQAAGQVLTVDADDEALPAREWLHRYDLTPDFADDYRGMTDPWYSPDLAQLTVPTPDFVAEVDAVLAAASMAVPEG